MSLRVIFSTHPAHGHLNPLLPVAHACRDAGHEVLFATAPRFCETVRSHGFDCRPAGHDYLWSEPLVSFPEIADAPRGPDQVRWLIERIGVPMVLTCLAADHWYNAKRCAELGLARVVGRDAQSAQGLSSLVGGALADDQLQAGAAAMKAAFADLPDVSEAVPLLEQLAREKTPVTQLLAAAPRNPDGLALG